MHTDDDVPLEYCPAWHDMQVDAASSEYLPATQEMHVVAPELLHVPLEHSKQLVEPATPELDEISCGYLPLLKQCSLTLSINYSITQPCPYDTPIGSSVISPKTPSSTLR